MSSRSLSSISGATRIVLFWITCESLDKVRSTRLTVSDSAVSTILSFMDGCVLGATASLRCSGEVVKLLVIRDSDLAYVNFSWLAHAWVLSRIHVGSRRRDKFDVHLLGIPSARFRESSHNVSYVVDVLHRTSIGPAHSVVRM